MCNDDNADSDGAGGDDASSSGTQAALEEAYQESPADFAEQWGIDVDTGALNPVDAPDGTETQ